MIRITFDIGFSAIKIATLKDGESSPKYFKEHNAVCDLGTENYEAYTDKEKDIVAYNGRHYIVGKAALQKNDSVIQKVVDFQSMKDITPIIATKYLNEYDPNDVEYICFTLSSAYLDYSKEFHKHLTDSLPNYKGKIKLIPQGAGIKKSIDNIGLDVDNPSYKDSYKNYLIIDIGFNTIDVCSVVNGALLPGDIKGYEHTGAVLIAEEIQKQIKSKFDISLDISRVKPILEEKSFKIRADTYDCSEIVKKAVELYLEVLRDFLEKTYADELNAISNVILMGGGSCIIQDNAEQWKDYYGEGFMLFPKVPGSATFYNSLGGLYLTTNKAE